MNMIIIKDRAITHVMNGTAALTEVGCGDEHSTRRWIGKVKTATDDVERVGGRPMKRSPLIRSSFRKVESRDREGESRLEGGDQSREKETDDGSASSGGPGGRQETMWES